MKDILRSKEQHWKLWNWKEAEARGESGHDVGSGAQKGELAVLQFSNTQREILVFWFPVNFKEC